MRDSALENAFRATTYRVDVGGEVFDLRVEEGHPAFSFWLKEQGISNWSIVTACNPGSKLAQGQNVASTLRLQEAIVERAWHHVTACNFADAGNWPDEPGFCVFDADEEALRMLAIEFGQTAIVRGSADDGRGEIVWLDGHRE